MFWTHSIAQSYQRALRDESHIDFHTHCVIMTQRTWPPATCYLSHLQIFDKIDRFPKNVFRIRKANCIFEELSNLCLIVLQISFYGLQQKVEPSWRNYLFELQNQAENNTTNIQTPPLSATAIMLVIFSTDWNSFSSRYLAQKVSSNSVLWVRDARNIHKIILLKVIIRT